MSDALKKVFLAVNHVKCRETIKNNLNRTGFVVIDDGDLQSARQQLLDSKVDCDVLLIAPDGPGQEGLALIKAIHTQNRICLYPDIPAVLMASEPNKVSEGDTIRLNFILLEATVAAFKNGSVARALHDAGRPQCVRSKGYYADAKVLSVA